MYQMTLDNELIVDNFAGGGGASCGIEMGLHRPVSIAINHDADAIAMHTANHPTTEHFCEDVWEVNPRLVTKGRKISLAWFSPDCKHFSKAKGGRPVEKKIRGLAWVVLRWASLPEAQKPRVIILENVEEFTTWGPLVDGKPCPDRKGRTFQSFVNALKRQGYVVEWRELRASDYGAPTIRKRLFLVARCDGQPIVWPNPTHGDPGKPAFKTSGLLPWRTAAECIDWDLPAQSIFARTKPLAENTLKRVAKGFKRFVIETERPFIVPVCHGDAPGQEPRCHDIDKPLPTITAKNKHSLVIPYLTEHANASNPRVFPVDEPLRTQCAEVKGGHFAMVAAYMTKFRTGAVGSDLKEPCPTITAGSYVKRAGGNGHALGLVSAFMVRQFGQSIGSPCDAPVGTITAGGSGKTSVAMPFLAKHFGGVVGAPVDTPMPTIMTAGSQTQLVAAYVNKFRGQNTGHPVGEPLHTVSAGGTHHALTSAYLVKYYGAETDGQALSQPLGTVTSKDRFGIVQVETHTPTSMTEEQRYNAWWVTRFLEDYKVIPEAEAFRPRPSFLLLGDWIVWDIVMRMFAPRELFRAQGFPESYIIDRTADGRPLTKVTQVQKCGNSVCPVMAKVLSAANVAPPQLITTQTRLQA